MSDPPIVIFLLVWPSYLCPSLPFIFTQLLPLHLFCNVEVWVRCPFIEWHPPYLYASFHTRSMYLSYNKCLLHQHAWPDDLPHNLHTPHSNELPHPFICIIASMGLLQHLANYTRQHTSHTSTHPNSSAHGHLFHPGTLHGLHACLPSVTFPLCMYQGACALPNTTFLLWVCPSPSHISEFHAISLHITECSPKSHITEHGHLYYGFSLLALLGTPDSNTWHPRPPPYVVEFSGVMGHGNPRFRGLGQLLSLRGRETPLSLNLDGFYLNKAWKPQVLKTY